MVIAFEKNLTPFGFVPDELLEKVVVLGGILWDNEYHSYIILRQEQSGEFIQRDETKKPVRDRDGKISKSFQKKHEPFLYWRMEQACKNTAKGELSEKDYWFEVFKTYERLPDDILPDL